MRAPSIAGKGGEGGWDWQALVYGGGCAWRIQWECVVRAWCIKKGAACRCSGVGNVVLVNCAVWDRRVPVYGERPITYIPIHRMSLPLAQRRHAYGG